MADGALAHNLFALHALEHDGRHVAPRGEDLLTGGVPCYGVYPTRDGRWLAVGALEAKFWRALCAAIGRPDLVAGQLATGDEGARVRGELDARVRRRERSPSGSTALDGVDRCVTPVATLDEALRDPQFAARGMVVDRRSDGSRDVRAAVRAISGHAFAVRRRGAGAGRAQRRGAARGGLSTRRRSTR